MRALVALVAFACGGAMAAPPRTVVYLTSYPAKLRFGFELDDVQYMTNVVQRNLGGKLVPAGR